MTIDDEDLVSSKQEAPTILQNRVSEETEGSPPAKSYDFEGEGRTEVGDEVGDSEAVGWGGRRQRWWMMTARPLLQLRSSAQSSVSGSHLPHWRSVSIPRLLLDPEHRRNISESIYESAERERERESLKFNERKLT